MHQTIVKEELAGGEEIDPLSNSATILHQQQSRQQTSISNNSNSNSNANSVSTKSNSSLINNNRVMNEISAIPKTINEQQHQQATMKSLNGNGSGNCCAGCNELIKDKFIFNVIDLNWHQECVQCSDCFKKLNEKCYTFEGKLYCKFDYWRRFGPKCFACKELIDHSELVQKIKSTTSSATSTHGQRQASGQDGFNLQIYHLECFTCNDCNRQLKQGEQLHLMDNGRRLLCEQDYLVTLKSPPSSIGNNTNLIGNNCTSNNNTLSTANNNTATTNNSKSNNRHDNSAASFYSIISDDSKQADSKQAPDDVNSADLKLKAGEEKQQNPELDELDEEEILEDSEDEDDGDSTTADGDHHPASNRFNFNARSSLAKGQLLSNSSDCGDDMLDANGKRRGPRTTIKPKQLETLRRAFEQHQKPARQVREKLASETGLNMRVIQVWFQNRRSKERRMKNSNGNFRRNLGRTSSRRFRNSFATTAPPGSGTPTTNGSQQSLIAGARPGNGPNLVGKNKGSQLSPAIVDSTRVGVVGPQEQLLNSQQQQQQQINHHHSPSEFGGSSSGGFTYFSDSSNQGEAFAINNIGQQQQQSQGTQPQQQQQQQYLPLDNLMALESPTSAGGQSTQAQVRQQQQQHGNHHQLMKNTPPPPPTSTATQSQLYNPGPPLMMGSGGAGLMPPLAPHQPGPAQQQMQVGLPNPNAHLNLNHHHHHHHLNHPGQQQSVVQW